MKISPKPPGNTVQEKTTKPLQGGSEYDNCTLSYSLILSHLKFTEPRHRTC